MVCKGDTTQFCGAGSRLSVWSITMASASTLSVASSVSPSSTAVMNPRVAGGSYIGCVSETSPRALNADSNSVSTQTLELCAQRAVDKNYRYFGLQYSSECYLADVVSSASVRLDETRCNMPCSGNRQQLCGGSMAMSLFNNTLFKPRIPLTVKASNGINYTYQGCFSDQGSPRTLSAYSTSQRTNTVQGCAQLCHGKGYSWAGAEYGAECYCSNVGPGTASLKSDAECSKPCAGNAKENCGGSKALQVCRQVATS